MPAAMNTTYELQQLSCVMLIVWISISALFMKMKMQQQTAHALYLHYSRCFSWMQPEHQGWIQAVCCFYLVANLKPTNFVSRIVSHRSVHIWRLKIRRILLILSLLVIILISVSLRSIVHFNSASEYLPSLHFLKSAFRILFQSKFNESITLWLAADRNL